MSPPTALIVIIVQVEGVLHPTSGFLRQKIEEMDEFKFPNMPKVDLIEWETPIDSSDMAPSDWVHLASDIMAHYWDYDGFVILQGTDTMCYSAAALSFMLENLGKPVILSGAMIPLHYPHSDGRRNLIMSVLCAGTLDIPEVCIYSNNQLFRGNRTTKVSNMTIGAFDSPNYPTLAHTGFDTSVEVGLVLPYPQRRFSIFTQLHEEICVLRLVPGFSNHLLEAFVKMEEKQVPRALVFALYGTGNAPLRKDSFLKFIHDAIAQGITIVITTQCLYGRTNLKAYATGVELLSMGKFLFYSALLALVELVHVTHENDHPNIGVIAAMDMTTEACVTKLAYLMGKGLTGRDLKRMMEKNLRGELSTVNTAAHTNTMPSSTSQGRITQSMV